MINQIEILKAFHENTIHPDLVDKIAVIQEDILQEDLIRLNEQIDEMKVRMGGYEWLTEGRIDELLEEIGAEECMSTFDLHAEQPED